MDADFRRLIEAGSTLLPGRLGLEFTEHRPGLVRGGVEVAHYHMAPNGYLHAATVIALADSACGYGCFLNRPEGSTGFTTIELKANFLGSGQLGDRLLVEATRQHGGRTTQVWDAVVTNESSRKTVALFRCTQLLLY